MTFYKRLSYHRPEIRAFRIGYRLTLTFNAIDTSANTFPHSSNTHFNITAVYESSDVLEETGKVARYTGSLDSEPFISEELR